MALTACDPIVAGRVCLNGDSNAFGLVGALHFSLASGQILPDGTLGEPDGVADFLKRKRSEIVVPISVVSGAKLSKDVAEGISLGRHATSEISCTQAVVSYGANDIGALEVSAEPEALDGWIDAFLGIPELSGIPVLWIAPNPTGAAYPKDRIEAWHQALQRASERWPMLEVETPPTEWLSADGVHFSPLGYTELANTVADRLLEMLPPEPSPTPTPTPEPSPSPSPSPEPSVEPSPTSPEIYQARMRLRLILARLAAEGRS